MTTENVSLDNYLFEIEVLMNKLPARIFQPTEFYFLSEHISFKKLGHTQTNQLISEISAVVEKKPANSTDVFGQTKQVEPYEHIKNYWKKHIAGTIKNDKSSYITKAIAVIEQIQDLNEVYPDQDIISLENALYEMHEKLIKLHKKSGEADTYEALTENDKNISMKGFYSSIFGDKKKIKELNEHNKQGKFKKGVPFKVKMYKRVEME